MINLIALNKMVLATESGNVTYNKGDKLKLQVDNAGNPYVVSEGTKRVTNGAKISEKKVQFNIGFVRKDMFENFLKHVAFENNFDLKESAKSKDFQKISIINALVHEGLDSSKLIKGVLNGSVKAVSKDGKLESFEVPVRRINKILSVREKIELIKKDKPVVLSKESITCKLNVLKVKKVRAVESLGYLIKEDEMDVQPSDTPAAPDAQPSKEDIIAKINAVMSERGLILSDLGLEDGQTLDSLEIDDLNDIWQFLTDMANDMDSDVQEGDDSTDSDKKDDEDKKDPSVTEEGDELEGDKDVATDKSQEGEPELKSEEDEDDMSSDASFDDEDDKEKDDTKSS